MDYKTALLALVSYCQQNSILSSSSAVCDELAEIMDTDPETVEYELF